MTSKEQKPGTTLVERLRLWLMKRGEPDSGLHYEGRSYNLESGAIRESYVTLTGSDADFIAAEFHGEGARELASALLALEGERDALREALEPFAAAITRYDAEWDDKSGSQAREPDEEKVTFLGWLGDYFDMVTLGDLRRARAALSSSSEHI
jgi:hypothetical protein